MSSLVLDLVCAASPAPLQAGQQCGGLWFLESEGGNPDHDGS